MIVDPETMLLFGELRRKELQHVMETSRPLEAGPPEARPRSRRRRWFRWTWGVAWLLRVDRRRALAGSS